MLRDIGLVFGREFRMAMRNPAWIGISLMQPLLYLFFFGPMMERIVASTPGFPPGTAWQILTPALIVQLGLFASAFAGFGILAELRTGSLERMRVTPVSRMAIMLGKVANNVLQLVVQAILLTVITVVVFDLRAPLSGVLLSLVLAALLGTTLASVSYGIALVLKSEESFPALLNAVLMPVFLLSGILIPITQGLAPKWLYVVSRINPFTHVMNAERALFRADFAASGLFTGVVVLLVMTVLAVWWGARTFQKENA